MAITDKIVPTLTLTTPKATSTQVKVGSNLVLKFNESVKVGAGNIIISDGKDIHKIAIADKSQVTFAGNTIRLNPTDNLLPNSHYSVRISATAITDLAGNKFAGILNTTALSFSTVDTLSPQLDVITTKNLSAPAVTKNLVFTFNEAVKAGAGIIVLSNGFDTRKIAITDKSQVTFDGKTITLNPEKDLQGDSLYSVTFRNTVIKDLAGNKFAGVSDKTVLSFHTVDNVAPQLDALSVENLSAPIAIDKNLVLVFNEAVKAGVGNIVVSNGIDTRTIPVTDSQVSINDKTVTINPTVDLNFGSTYSVKLAAGTLNDMAGNAFSGNEPKALVFTTVAKPIVIDTKPFIPVAVIATPATDEIAPTLTSSSPADNSTNILAGANLVLTFSEAMKAGSGNIVISNGSDIRTISIADKTQITMTDKTVTINPTTDFVSETTYNVLMATGVLKDVAGNSFAGITDATALDFTTTAAAIITTPVVTPPVYTPPADTTPPTPVYTPPADTTPPTVTLASSVATVKVGEAATITATFSEAVTGFTVDDFVSAAGTFSHFVTTDSSHYSALFTPTPSSTATDSAITIAANSYTDTAGNNGGAGTKPTLAIDMIAPTVTLASSVAAVKVGETATITASFSEAVTGFTVDDFVSAAGAFSHFVTTDSSHYSALFIPTVNSVATDSAITIAANSYTDTAGNNGGAGTKPTLAIDMIAPTVTLASFVAAVKVGETATITASFSEAVTGFTVDDFVSAAGTFSHFVTTDSSHYSALFTPTPSSTATDSAITIAANSYTDTAGNNGGAGTKPTLALDFTTAAAITTPVVTTPVVPTPVITTGKAIDGYLSGSDVFADANGDGVWNEGEAKATTDKSGNFTLSDAKGTIHISGGTDLSTGKAFQGVMKAPEGSTVVTPFTTVQQGFIESGQTPAQAEKSVATAFGFDAEKVDLTKYDPIAELVKAVASGTTDAVATQMVASSAQIANFFVTAGQVLQGAAGGSDNVSTQNVGDALLKSLVTSIQNDAKTGDGKINLADSTLLKIVIVDGAKEVNTHAEKVATDTGSNATLKFDTANFSDKIDKLADTVAAVLKTAADNITATVSKGGDALTLLSNIDKVSAFTQNDAGKSLSDVAKTLDTKNTASLDAALKDQADLFTGDKATKATEAKVVETKQAVTDVIAADKAAADKAIADAAAKAISDAAAAKAISDAAAAKAISDAAAAKAISDAAATKAISDAAAAKAISDAAAAKVISDAAAAKVISDAAAAKVISDAAAAQKLIDDAAAKVISDAAAAKVISDAAAAQKLIDDAAAAKAAADAAAAANSNNGGGGSVADTTAPTLSSSTPADNATSVAFANDIVLTFSEAVQKGTTGNIVITNATDTTDTRTISITEAQVTVSGSTVTINPTNDLKSGDNYNVQITSGAIKDSAGNSYAGISDATTLNFTTALPALTLSGAATANEGDAIIYTVTSSVATATGFTVPYTLSGTNITTADFKDLPPLTGNINIAANATTGTLTLYVANDIATEGVENLLMTLGATTGATLAVATKTTAIADVAPSAVISAAGTTTATSGNDIYVINAGGYTHTIAGFAAGDKLRFSFTASLNVLRDTDQADGSQSFTASDPNSGATTTIILTGITAAQDDALFNVPSINTVFGSGTIA